MNHHHTNSNNNNNNNNHNNNKEGSQSLRHFPMRKPFLRTIGLITAFVK